MFGSNTSISKNVVSGHAICKTGQIPIFTYVYLDLNLLINLNFTVPKIYITPGSNIRLIQSDPLDICQLG